MPLPLVSASLRSYSTAAIKGLRVTELALSNESKGFKE